MTLQMSGDSTSGVHFPPPLLYVGFFLIGVLLERAVPVPLPRIIALPAALLLLASGSGLLGWSLLRFLRARTSPLPMRPTTSLVVSGPYRWTRNPMYLGMLLLYLGVALWMDAFWPLVFAPLVVLAVNRLVIRKEEQYLRARFGDVYRQYTAEVRRWL